jgi:hypothetical protein
MTQLDIFTGEGTSPSFDEDALGFLLGYASCTRGRAFSAEDVTLAALEAGLAPMDLRAWGRVFAQASRDNLIRRSDVLFRRSMGNGTLVPGWVST